MHCVKISVIFKIYLSLLLILEGACIISFNFCLFTWAVYLLMFRIDMAVTRVSCCLVCPCISWFTHFLISHVSLMVAEPVSHFSASPKKGKKPLLYCGFSDGDRFSNSASILSNSAADHMVAF